MKFRIGEKHYDVEQGAAKATLQTLYVMKTKYGVGIKDLAEVSKKFKKFKNPIDILDDPEAFNAFRAMIWLARVHAGENLTFEEACSFPLDELVFEDEAAEESEPDPKAAPGTDPGAEPVPEPPNIPTT